MIKRDFVTELGSREFLETLKDKKNPLVIADFYTEWCINCLMIAPVMESIAEKNKKIKFVKINVEEAQELALHYQINPIPCIIFFRDGEEVDRIDDDVNEAKIEEKIKALK